MSYSFDLMDVFIFICLKKTPQEQYLKISEVLKDKNIFLKAAESQPPVHIHTKASSSASCVDQADKDQNYRTGVSKVRPGSRIGPAKTPIRSTGKLKNVKEDINIWTFNILRLFLLIKIPWPFRLNQRN